VHALEESKENKKGSTKMSNILRIVNRLTPCLVVQNWAQNPELWNSGPNSTVWKGQGIRPGIRNDFQRKPLRGIAMHDRFPMPWPLNWSGNQGTALSSLGPLFGTVL
jgi:hypothetical protein